MKKAICFLVLIFITANIFAQTKTNYAVAVSFNSKCCGVPDAKPLFAEILKFKKLHKIKSIAYDNIGPLGREGEFMIGFDLKELTKKKKALFIAMLNKIVPSLKTDHDANSSGNADVRVNEKKIDVKDLGRSKIVTEKI